MVFFGIFCVPGIFLKTRAAWLSVINVPVAITEAEGGRIWWTAQIDAPAPGWLSIDPEFPDFGVTPGRKSPVTIPRMAVILIVYT